MNLKPVCFTADPKHFTRLGEIARSKGLSASSLLRVLIAEYISKNRPLVTQTSK
jgi:hypothetical protein